MLDNLRAKVVDRVGKRAGVLVFIWFGVSVSCS